MEIILKTLIALLIFGCLYTSLFIAREYKKFFKSVDFEESSTFEKFIMSLLAFSGVAFFIVVSLFCMLLEFCKIQVSLPW